MPKLCIIYAIGDRYGNLVTNRNGKFGFVQHVRTRSESFGMQRLRPKIAIDHSEQIHI